MQTLLAGQCDDYTPCPFGGGVCRWCQKPEGEHPAKDPARDRLEDLRTNLPPGLIESKDYPELKGKVRVTLDGEDVTARCRAFSVDPGMVVLYVLTEKGKTVLESVCGCGPRHFSRRFTCETCGEKILLRAKTEERRGLVGVTPLEAVP